MALQSPQYPAEVQESKRGLKKADLVVPGARRGIAEDRSTLARTQPGKPFLGANDMVIVKNVDNVTWRFEWDRRKYDIKPSASLQIPFPAVINAMGDPRSVEGGEITFRTENGERGVIQSRYDTLMMLMSRYGIEGENVQALVDFAPKIEVTTLTGMDVSFPVQNPGMTAWPTPQAPEPGREQPTDTRQLIQRYEEERAATTAELSELRGMVTKLMGGEAPQGTPDPRQPAGPSAAAEALLGGPEGDDVPLGGAVPDSGPRSQV